MGNNSLNKAKEAKQDEFYTQLTDIEKELQYYRDHFRNKVVFCNCDDPEWSNFWRFFSVRFNLFGLKKLIATHYEQDKPSYMLSMERVGNETPTVIKHLRGNGDFRSAECVALLKEADIVVTNPPFSLFREYLTQLMEHKKKFVIIGNQNCITYKEIFPLLKDNHMWLGYRSGAHEFKVPASYTGKISRTDKDGQRYAKLGNIVWFTNLDIKKRHEDLKIFRHYTPEEYPHYDNYDAINVDKVVDIPCDYDGMMGVPITFLQNYNPAQFEILGCTEAGNPFCKKFYTNMYQHMNGTSFYNTKSARYAPMVQHFAMPNKSCYTVNETPGYLTKTYFRIFIRRKKA